MKDRASGLAFRWRGGNAASTFSYIIAFLVSAVIVLFLLFGINIETSTAGTRDKVKGTQVAYISSEHPQLMALPQFSSPLPPSWDPLEDAGRQDRIGKLLAADLLIDPVPAISLKPIPPMQADLSLPRVAKGADHLPRMRSRKAAKKPPVGHCTLRLDFSDAALSDRLEKNYQAFAGALPWHERGKQMAFQIHVNADGAIALCTPLTKDPLPGVEAWLRNLTFTPENGGEGKEIFAKITLTVTPAEK